MRYFFFSNFGAPVYMKSFLLILSTLCLCVLSHDSLFSQIPVAQIRVEPLTIRDGLSQGYVPFIVQDKQGFMWFATKDGLNKYDGYRFTIFRHDVSDSTSIASNDIGNLFVDEEGMIWINLPGMGVDVFNPVTEKFFYLTHNDGNTSVSLSSPNIIELDQADHGCVWIHTNEGFDLAKYSDKGEISIRHFSFKLSKTQILNSKLLRDHSGKTWLIIDSMLYRVLPDNENLQKELTLPFNISDGKWYFNVEEDSQRRLLYFFYGNEIEKFNERAGSMSKIDLPFKEELSIEVPGIDQSGAIWFRSLKGPVRFNPMNDKLELMMPSGENLKGTELNSATAFVTDRTGVMWIGTGGFGVMKYNPRLSDFNLVKDFNGRSIYPYWMIGNNTGEILIRSDNHFLVYSTKQRSFKGWLIDSLHILKWAAPSGINGTAALQDHYGNYWVANNFQLMKFDSALNKKKIFNQRDHENWKWVFPIAIHYERVWFMTRQSLGCINIVTDSITSYPLPSALIQYLPTVQCMVADEKENIWLATNAGLYCFNSVDHSWKHFNHDKNNSTSLNYDHLLTLCFDPTSPEKYLWIGTDGGGLDRLDLHNEKFDHFTISNGLPNNTIYGIVPADNGTIWLSTNNGLACMNISQQTFRNYDVSDGLQSNEFNHQAYCRTKDGYLCFGGVNGFNFFKPANLLTDSISPPVAFTDFRLFNKSVSLRDANSVLHSSINTTQQLILPYNQRMFTFEFAALDFSSPEKNHFRYKMSGFDHDWVDGGNRHEATYTNLDPGTYTFSVLAANSSGVWNNTGASIKIVILTPWFRSWWFYSLIVLVAAGALYALYRYRVKQLLRLQTIRNRIASDLHDEIGSTLSSISIYSDVIAEEMKESSPEARAIAQRISASTTKMMESMSDIVWTINPRNDRFTNILSRMQSFASELLEAKNATLHFHVDERVKQLKLGMEARKNFYLVFKESVNNIAKYANAKNVWIEIGMVNEELHLSIRDDGTGFDAEKVFLSASRNGNGLINMKERTESLSGTFSILSSPELGTQIEMRFPATKISN